MLVTSPYGFLPWTFFHSFHAPFPLRSGPVFRPSISRVLLVKLLYTLFPLACVLMWWQSAFRAAQFVRRASFRIPGCHRCEHAIDAPPLPKVLQYFLSPRRPALRSQALFSFL